MTQAGAERVVAFDEGRFGLKMWFRRRWCTFGHRPPWIVDDRYEWVWVYVAITPTTGECCCLLLPHVDTICLNLFLATVREEWPDERIGVVLDGSGSHRSDKVTWPQGIMPLPLPPYSPELDPAEQVFRHLRKRLANRIFATIEELKDVLTAELQRLWEHPKVVIRMTNYPWWHKGVNAITPSLS
ncbi:MAG: IS630 family transposase [Chloroflexota bacterium]|nr:IS630 family transposase [Chloroflexota bacterium]